MAKLNDSPITVPDLIEHLNTSSDFAFELRCLELIGSMGFECRHAGSYTDRVTKKTRQFDLRVQRNIGDRWRVRCAIECKNLRHSFPLLVSCVPRSVDESFHYLISAFHPDLVERSAPPTYLPDFRERCKSLRADSPFSAYRPGDPVGKNCAQIGRSHDNAIVTNDFEVFEKWSQALASAQDLADDSTEEGEARHDAFVSLVLPVLVVPDGTLWTVEFASNGTRCTDPSKTDRCSFFVGQFYSAGSTFHTTGITISHLEFVTCSGLKSLMGDITRDDKDNRWFPIEKMIAKETHDDERSKRERS
jgi:hypothetical protein